MDCNALWSVCQSTFSILAKRLSGIIQWDAVGDGGWEGLCIGVLDFDGDRRREGQFWEEEVWDFPL